MDGFSALLLVVGATAVAAAARRLRLPAPLLLVLAGLVASYLPGVPSYELDPDVVLLLFLPPLLYAASLESSYVGFRANLRPIGLLSVGLVLFSTLTVGLVAHAVIPDLPLAAAFVLGAVVAPPDAVAASAVGRRVGLPRRLVTIMAGESLVNDATALTAYRVAVAAAVGEGYSLLTGTGVFVLSAMGGVAVGLLLAKPLHWLRRRVRDPVTENAVSVLIPFVAYLTAEQIHASGVLSVVVVGLYLGHRSPDTSYATRIIEASVWKVVDFLLVAIVFALIGLQLRVVLGDLGDRSTASLVWYGVVVTATVVVVRFVWVFPATYVPRMLSASLRVRDPSPPWRVPAVLSWAGMRGVVSLAAAFAVPQTTDAGDAFPERDLILFLTFCVVVATLLLQGLTLPTVIRWADLPGRESYDDALAEAQAQQYAAEAAVARLDAVLSAQTADPPEGVAERLREWAERRQLGAWERLGSGPGPGQSDTPSNAYRRLRREMLTAEREVFVRLRNERRIDDEVMRRVMRELDMEEAMLSRD